MSTQHDKTTLVNMEALQKLKTGVVDIESDNFSLLMLIPVLNGDSFIAGEYFRACNEIYDTYYASEARSALWDVMEGKDKNGTACLIALIDYPVVSKTSLKVVGITGFFFVNEVLENGAIKQHAVLRWHGVKPEFRAKGYSTHALSLIRQYLKENHDVQYIHETTVTDQPVEYFTILGFRQNHPAVNERLKQLIHSEAGCHNKLLTCDLDTDFVRNKDAVAIHEAEWAKLIGDVKSKDLLAIAESISNAAVNKFPDLSGTCREAPDLIVPYEVYQQLSKLSAFNFENRFRTAYNLPVLKSNFDAESTYLYTEDPQLLLDIVNMFKEHISHSGVSFSANLQKEVFDFAIKQRQTEVGGELASLLKIPSKVTETEGKIIDRYVVIFHPEYEAAGGRSDFQRGFTYLIDAVKYAINTRDNSSWDLSGLCIYDRISDRLFYLN